jgi:hypothetical protein
MMRWKGEETGGTGETRFGNMRLDVVETSSEGFLTEGGIRVCAICVTVLTWCECGEIDVRWMRGRTGRMCPAIDIKPSSTRTEV